MIVVNLKINAGILRRIIKAVRSLNPEDIQSAISDFNSTLTLLRSQNLISNARNDAKASHEFLVHVLEQAYGRTVGPKSHILREYEVYKRGWASKDLLSIPEILKYLIFLLEFHIVNLDYIFMLT